MGASYSQPPRGFQYSKLFTDIPGAREDPDFAGEPKKFQTFEELFTNNLDNEKNLIYISELKSDGKVKNYTYGEIFSRIQTFRSQIDSFPSILGIYAKNSVETQILLDASLFYNIPVFASSPEIQSFEEFIEKSKQINIQYVFCDKELKQNMIKHFKNIFTEIKQIHLPASTNKDREPVIYNPLNPEITISFEMITDCLSSWSKRLNICRDAKVCNMFGVGSNAERIVRSAVIFNRATFLIPQEASEESMSTLNPTHIFAHSTIYEKFDEVINQKYKDMNFVLKPLYCIAYAWKNIKICLGSSSKMSDKIISSVTPKLGVEIRFFYTDGILPSKIHDEFTITTGLPLATMFVPFEWGNYGAALPSDVRFTKYGTVGGPVGCAIKVEDDKLVCLANEREVDYHGVHWDEEGSLDFTKLEKN